MAKKESGKKAISPVIVTVLLISIVLVLALIIFLWARSFIDEEAQKFGESIKNACNDVQLSAQMVSGNLVVTNQGSRVPVYALNLRSTNGDISKQSLSSALAPSHSTEIQASNIEAVIPILRGQKDGQEIDYVCTGKEFSVF